MISNNSSINRDLKICLISLTTFMLLWYLFIGNAIFREGYIWDDLHWFRQYSYSELFKVWFSNWDVDQVETPAYRPLGTLFYHILGTIFQENTFLFRIFYLLLFFILISIVNFFFLLLGAKKEVIIILNFLVICSKIFSTLISWFTLSVLVISYIFFFTTFVNFYLFKLKKKKNYLLYSILSCFIAIYTREELYTLFFIIPFFSLYIERDLKKTLKESLPFFIIILSHYLIRDTIVPDASKISLNLSTLNILDFIKSIIASSLPMSFYKPHTNDPVNLATLVLWIIFLFYILFESLKKFNLLRSKIFFYLFGIICGLISCTPNLIFPRSFGILIPSIFFYFIIASLISEIFLYKKENSKLLLTSFFLIIAYIGGLNRSQNQIIAVNEYSAQIISYDSLFVYGFPLNGWSITIPKKRLDKKIFFLNKLGVYSFVTVEQLKTNNNQKIIFSKYPPLSF